MTTSGVRERPCTALICDYDPTWLSITKVQVRDAGFEVVGDASTVVGALQLSMILEPSLVIVTNEHSGLTGLEAIEDFRNQAHRPEVLVLSTSEIDRHVFLERGAFLLVGRFDVEAFADALVEIREFLISGERRTRSERRNPADRRVEQNWGAVSSERRHQGSRRVGGRRGADDSADVEPELDEVWTAAIARANAAVADWTATPDEPA